MNKSPLVSVIMNCYNGEKYLNDSLNSLLSQNYSNWELIFWDNISTDNSKKILRAIKIKGLNIIRQQNMKFCIKPEI